MAAKLKLIPGSTIRWGARRFVLVDYVGLDAVIAREVGKRIRFAGGKLRKANLDLWVTRNTGVVTNAAYPLEGRRRGSPQSHRRRQPLENHNPPTFFIRK